jgi:hypothetical protein
MSRTKTVIVPIKDLKIDLFVRQELNHDHAIYLGLLIENGVKLPAIKMTPDHTVVDGRHRIEAYVLNNLTEIEAEIVEFDSEIELISCAYRANTGGALPPTQADTEHTVMLLLDRNVPIKRIGEVLGLPAGLARKYVTTIKSKVMRQKLTQASFAVTESGLTVPKAAEQYGVEPEELKKILVGNRKKQKSGIADDRRNLTKTYRALSQKNAHALRGVHQRLVDGDVSLAQARDIMDHIEQLQKRAARAVSERRKRIEAQFPQLVEPSKKR